MYKSLALLILGLWAAGSLASESPSFDARLSQYSYPFPVSQYALSSQRQSLEMAYMHLPGDAEKPTVLLLHGKNFAADYWQGLKSLARCPRSSSGSVPSIAS